LTAPPKKGLIFFSVFLFFAETLRWELLGFSLKLLGNHAVWLEDLLQFSILILLPIEGPQ